MPVELERRHLHHHADSASTTNTPPTIDQRELVLGQHREHAERAAERERADVAHEHLRRVGVEPEEADAGADHRAAEDRQLARRRAMCGIFRYSAMLKPLMTRRRRRTRGSGTCRRAMITGPIARPSRPSVRLTALDAADDDERAERRMYDQRQQRRSGACRSRRSGSATRSSMSASYSVASRTGRPSRAPAITNCADQLELARQMPFFAARELAGSRRRSRSRRSRR